MDINIKIVRADHSKPFMYFERYIPFISEERQKRIERIRSDRDRINSLFAELLIRAEASRELNMPFRDISFEYGEHGKPSVAGREDYHFSVSHSGDVIAFASAGVPVGIDAERDSRANLKIAKRFFTPHEYDFISGSTEMSSDFCRVWTSKEAYVKLIGTGLSTPFSLFDVLDKSSGCRFYTDKIEGGYTFTVCTDDGEYEYFRKMMTSDEFTAYLSEKGVC